MGAPISGKPGVLGPIADGSPVEVGVDSWGALLSISKGPNYLEWTRRGYMYSGNVSPAAPAAIPIYSTATNSPTLWNPADSGKLVVPVRINFSLGAIAAIAVTGIELAYLANAGSAVGTGAPFSVFTNIAPKPLLIGGASGKAKFSGAAVTFTTQPTVLMELGIQQAMDGTEANFAFDDLHYDFNGMVALPPGAAISVVSVVGTGTTWVTSIIFAELPLPTGL